ncbi:MAG: TolC family protein [Bdellovibrio sp.]|nr:TolC family protein [Bdellovibrio sp.]
MSNNSELKSAYQSLESNQYSAKGAYSGFFPLVTGSFDYNESEGGTLFSRQTTDNQHRYSATLSANYSLFNGLQDNAKVAQAAAQLRSQEANLVAIKAKLSFDLKSAYAELLFAQRSLGLQQDIIRRREDNLKLVQLRFLGGRENKGSVLLSKAYLNQGHYEILQARNNIQVAQAQLSRVLGRDEELELTLDEDVTLETLSEAPDFRRIMLSTPDHHQFMAQEDSADAGIKAARSGFFPTLSLSASTGRVGSEWFPENENRTIGATLSFPLFGGGKDYYGTKSAVATFAVARASRENGDRQTLTRLKQAYTAYVEAIEKLKVDESFKQAALKRAEIARSKYNNGLMSFEDWDLIENDLIVREKTVLQAQRDRTKTEAAWQQSQGKGVIR